VLGRAVNWRTCPMTENDLLTDPSHRLSIILKQQDRAQSFINSETGAWDKKATRTTVHLLVARVATKLTHWFEDSNGSLGAGPNQQCVTRGPSSVSWIIQRRQKTHELIWFALFLFVSSKMMQRLSFRGHLQSSFCFGGGVGG